MSSAGGPSFSMSSAGGLGALSLFMISDGGSLFSMSSADGLLFSMSSAGGRLTVVTGPGLTSSRLPCLLGFAVHP